MGQRPTLLANWTTKLEIKKKNKKEIIKKVYETWLDSHLDIEHFLTDSDVSIVRFQFRGWQWILLYNYTIFNLTIEGSCFPWLPIRHAPQAKRPHLTTLNKKHRRKHKTDINKKKTKCIVLMQCDIKLWLLLPGRN